MKAARHLLLILPLLIAACGDDAKPDKVAPTISITTPSAGATVAAPITVSGDVVDPKIKGHKRSGIATVTVQGEAATLVGDRFSVTLASAQIGPLTITVAATDKAGNTSSATVDVVVTPPVTALHVEPPIVTVQSATQGVPVTVTGFFDESGSAGLVDGVTFEVEDPAVATVGPAGLVLAASPEAQGSTLITVRYQGLNATVTANVRIDEEAPQKPDVVGYSPDANMHDQTWTGTTEPGATITIDGSASPTPIVVVADGGGRFWVNVPLNGNRVHDIGLTATDTWGNTSARYPYPIRQSDGFVDAGMLHLSSERRAVGFVGEALGKPLVARAYNNAGAPLPGASVRFTVYSGGGALVAQDGPRRELVAVTDGDGYARAIWQLGSSDYDRVEVHAVLVGDTAFPVVFEAEGFARLGGETTVSGIVYDENRVPVVGLPVTLLEAGTEYANETRGPSATTDDRGRFQISAGAGNGAPQTRHMRFDGTALAEGARYVRIDDLVSVLPGQANDVGTFWIPHLPEGQVPVVDGSGVVTQEMVLEREVIPGAGLIRVRVPVGTKITWPGGVPVAARKLTLLGIPEGRTPMSLPDGFFSNEVLALQPGGTRFEPPLPLDMPNSSFQPPGEALTLWSYDHFESRFIPIGRGIVSADGARVVSEPGSGIRVGAWHKASPVKPPAPCTAKGKVSVTKPPGATAAKKKKQKCKCYLAGTDQPTECPEDKDDDGKPDEFIITNVPGCGSPPPPPIAEPEPGDADKDKPKPKPPARKIEVVCEEEPLEITQPSELEKTIKKGDTVTFRAECKDGGKSNGSIAWKKSSPTPKSNTGPTFTVKFEEEGSFVVSASSNTKTCKGQDQRVIKVKNCAETGVVRVCGDKVEPIGPPADERFKVSGNVEMGLKGSGADPASTSPEAGDLYLLSSSSVLVDPEGVTSDGPSMLSLDVDWPIVGMKRTPIAVTALSWTIDNTGLLKIPPSPKPTNLVKILQFSLGFEEVQMLLHGVYLKTPKLDIFNYKTSITTYTCPKPKVQVGLEPDFYPEYHPPSCTPDEFVAGEPKTSSELDITVDGVEMGKGGVTPTGSFEYKPRDSFGQPGLDLIKPVLKLNSVKLGYEKERFTGSLGLQINVKALSLGVLTSATWGDGYFAGDLDVSFNRPLIGGLELPGIPVFPATPVGPVYLTKIGVGYESTGWPVSDNSVVKLKGRAGLALGPSIAVAGGKYSLATGDVDLALTLYPLAFSAKGTFNLFSQAGGTPFAVELSAKSLSTLEATVDLVFEPTYSASVSGSYELKLPWLSDDAFAKGSLKGTVATVESDNSVIAGLAGGLGFKLPETPLNNEIDLFEVGYKIKYASRNSALEASASAQWRCLLIYTCTLYLENDAFNGMSIWIQNNKGDLVSLMGKTPSKRVSQIAPRSLSIGVDHNLPVDVVWDGQPANVELLEAAELFQITITKAEANAMQGQLITPSGATYGPVADPVAFAERLGVDYRESLDGQTVTWVVYDAAPGTYTVVAPSEVGVTSVTAYVPPIPPELVFDEPFVDDGDDLVVAWTGTGGTRDAIVTWRAIPVNDPQAFIDLDTTSFAGVNEYTLDDGDLPRGVYRIGAEVRSFGGSVVFVSASSHLLGVDPEPSADAPRLVRAAADDDGIDVSWLPVAGAEAYLVTFTDALGAQRASQVTRAPHNSARLTPDGGLRRGVVRVGLIDDPGASAVVPLEVTPRFADAPPALARVGSPWVYRGCTAPTITEGPWSMTVAGDTLTWLPSQSDLGSHTIRVSGCGVASFDVSVAAADTPIAPEPALVDEARHVAGVIGQPVTVPCTFFGVDPVTTTLVSGPLSATLVDGVVQWVPDVATAVAEDGQVAFTCRGASAGLERFITVFVHLADRDGDGMADDFERASGLNPNIAQAAADGDNDRLDDAAESALGTRGDLADSDGDGISDGAETGSPRLADTDGDGVADGAEVLAGTDPTKTDSDGDGVDDGIEQERGTDGGSAVDTDGDGLSDDLEAQGESDPLLADTDGDGLSDKDELYGWFQGGQRCSGPTNPRLPDTDSDGVDDATEAKRCDGLTDPNNAGFDQDGDGLRSDRERILGTSDLKTDTDGDGASDAVEVLVGTDPLDTNSKPDVDVVLTEPATKTGQSVDLVLAAGSLTDFGTIFVFTDADGDGAPDDYETQFTFDPADPSDAYDDTDGDGLAMWREAQLGTSPRSADSDGDGVQDGQELQDGTDPTDPTSFSTAGPVTTLTLYPRRAQLQQNTFLGSATLQLSVVGARADATSLDLTAPDRGTTYTVTPVEAGTVDARAVFTGSAGFVGTVTITANNLALQATSAIELAPFTPSIVTSVALGAAPTAVAIADTTVLVGGPWGLRLVDVTTPEAPSVIGDVALASAPNDIAVNASGPWVAVALGASGVSVVDRHQRLVIATIPTAACSAVTWAGGRIIAATAQGLVRVDVGPGIGLVDVDNDGRDDRVVDVQAQANAFTSVHADLDRIVAARADGHVLAYRLIGGGLVQEHDLTPGATATRVALRGGLVSGATGATASRLALGPAATWRASASLGIVLYTQPVESFVLATESTSGTVVFLDARGAAPLTTLGSVDPDAFYPTGLAVDRRYFYLGDGYNQKLHIGVHSVLNDVLGVAPVVVPVAPLAGTVVPEGTRLEIEVSATDDIGVASVTLTRDGEDIVTRQRAPHIMSVKTSNVSAPTSMAIGAYAVDYGANTGAMAPLIFQVTPIVDLVTPTVTLLEPSPEEFVASNSEVDVAVAPFDDHAVYAVEVRLGGVLVATLYDEPWTTRVTMPASAASGRVAVEVTAIDYGDNRASARADLVLAGVDLVAAGVTTLGLGDTTYAGQDVLVRKGTVALDGPHTFGKLRIGRDGVLTHLPTTTTSDAVGLDIMATQVDVAPTGRIDVSGKGYLGDCAPTASSCGGGPGAFGNVQTARVTGGGGGAHGGSGARRATTYGSWSEPTTLGGGGDYGTNGYDPGGNGGGRVRLVADAVVIDGVVAANGGNGLETGSRRGAGGAGGSIWISATTLGGAGRIEANGGFPASRAETTSGAGGGGRVALELDDDNGLGLVSAYPGASTHAAKGGAGTVWRAITGEPTRLIIDDGNRGAGADDFLFGTTLSSVPITLPEFEVRGTAQVVVPAPLVADRVTLSERAVLTQLETVPSMGPTVGGLDVTAAHLSVGPNARVDVTARGYTGDCKPGASCGPGPYGPGNVVGGRNARAGGSHGGQSGERATYGDWREPIALGGGGDYGANGFWPGGDGGGRVRLDVGTLVLDGVVAADGEDAPGLDTSSGSGGAGGSVWISANTLTGQGQITADGGATNNVGVSAGGGGRVAVTGGFAASLGERAFARPGAVVAGQPAGPGTVWLAATGQPTRLQIDDGGRSAGRDDRALGWDASNTVETLGDLIVRGQTRLILTRPIAAREIHLEGGALLSHLEATMDLEPQLNLVSERLVIGPDAGIDVAARGYVGDCKAGAIACSSGGRWLGNTQVGGSGQYSGGAHGGNAGGPTPNRTYGDPSAPAALGAAGGYGANGFHPGGDGGGRVRIQSQDVVLDGFISVDGGVGGGIDGPSGAGGSIWITTTTLSGAGLAHANGGGRLGASDGGGGRIAIQWQSSTFDVQHLQAYGGGPTGSPGTILVTPAGGRATLILDSGPGATREGRSLGFATSDTPLALPVDLVLRGTTHLALAAPLEVATLTLEGTSVLTHVPSSATYEGALSITADQVTIGRDAAIDVSGRGYLGDCAGASCGSGAYGIGNTTASGARQYAGGSYGGQGGGSSAAVHGDPRAPVLLGGGGGYGGNGFHPGGAGGGRVRIVTQRMQLDGQIHADGASVAVLQGGGGAGGSVYLTTGELGGAGVISANGGGATGTSGFSGGGGRIALGWATTLAGFDPEAIQAYGGATGAGAGGPGTIWLAGPGEDRLVVANGGAVNGVETAPWIELRAQTVVEVLTDGVRVAGTPGWRPGELVGHELTIAGATYFVVDNSADTLTLTSSVAAGAIGARVSGVVRIPGALEVRDGARVALADPLYVDTLTLTTGAVLTHLAPASGIAEPELTLHVAGTATVGAGAAIDVSGRGYLGDCGGGPSCGGGGYTLGNVQPGARQYAGGSYGGLGAGPVPGFIYGDPLRPNELGSGGGYGANGYWAGGRGGGRVHLVADTLVLDGALRADGLAPGPDGLAGGGAGGAIWLELERFGGLGNIAAVGGDGGFAAPAGGGGGGGGRVAIHWSEDLANDAFDVDAIDIHGALDVRAGIGGSGTLWLAPALGERRMIVDNAGQTNLNEAPPWVELGLATVATASIDRVTVSGVTLIADALVGRAVYLGTQPTPFTVIANTADTLVFASGDARATTGAAARARYTLDGVLELRGAARVAIIDRVAAATLVLDGAVLTHPVTNGTGPEHGVWLEIVGAVTIATDAAIDVTGRGYRGDCAFGDLDCGNGGHGPFGGIGGRQYSGGSFGGLGGGPSPNVVYGSASDTYYLGAGGGYGSSGYHVGGAGGGRVYLRAGSLTLGGFIRANGDTTTGANNGGGAGGGVHLELGQLSGAGSVSARGGAGNGTGGGGGGGRILVDAPGMATTLDASGGAGGALGAAGTTTRQ